MKPNFPPLPGVLGQIETEIGWDIAVQLAKSAGGREIYIPVTITRDCPLAIILGLKSAQEVSKLLGAGKVIIPCGIYRGQAAKRHQVKLSLKAGLSHDKIAAQFDLHLRTVQRLAARVRDEAQLEFDFGLDKPFT